MDQPGDYPQQVSPSLFTTYVQINFRLIFAGFFVKEERQSKNEEVLNEKGIGRFVFSLDYSGNGFRYPI
jgi:hypothetical protein